MKKILCLVAGLLFGTANATIIDFEGFAPSNSYTTFNNNSHIEDGFRISIPHGHIISSGFNPNGYNNHSVQNGTDWLMLDSTLSNILTANDNSLFSMQSFDFMGYSGSGIGNVIGTFSDNSTIQASVAYNSTQSTFALSSDWTGLKSVTFTANGFGARALDNIVLNTVDVPEPASILLLGLGLVGLSSRRKK
jgi:hypothetical protein